MWSGSGSRSGTTRSTERTSLRPVKRAVVLVAALAALAGSHARATPPEPVTLQGALAVSARLGPVEPSSRLRVLLALRGRHQQELDAALASGRAPGSPARYAPDPRRVRSALAAARAAGFAATWTRGDSIAS